MILAWLRRRRRRRLLATPFPAAWRPYLEPLPFYRTLTAEEQARLQDDLRVIVAEKRWEGCGGLVLTDEIRVTIAAIASLLILHLEHDYYRDVESIYVYPSTYRTPHRRTSEDGIVHEGSANLGEAWPRGPVVLSWDAVRLGAVNPRDARNVVLHEFAHKLDMLDGFVDGTPPLENREAYGAWHRIMTEEYQRLLRETRRGQPTLLDDYGATNPAEFFAVATECFFEKPKPLRKRHESLYGLLASYYRHDPASRPSPESKPIKGKR